MAPIEPYDVWLYEQLQNPNELAAYLQLHLESPDNAQYSDMENYALLQLAVRQAIAALKIMGERK